MAIGGQLSRYADRPEAEALLFTFAAMEGALLPVPTEDLLVPMVLLDEKQAFRYALVATVGSVVGALFAFEVAYMLFQAIWPFFAQLSWLQLPLAVMKVAIVDYSPLIVLAAGFSAVPYKVITFLSGFMGAGIVGFVFCSAVSRAARFFVMSWYLWRGGRDYQVWLERYFYGVSTVASLGLLLLLTLGVFLLKTS